MELYQLKSFRILAEEGSLRPAAERLFISQPTLSGHIKSLEAEFGFELFERSRKGMLLTAEGDQFHAHAERILNEASEAHDLVLSLRKEVSGTVRVGIINDGRDLQLDKTIVQLAQSHPNVKVDITNANTGLCIKALLDGTIDIGFIEGERTGDGLTKFHVGYSNPVIVYPSVWSELANGTWEDLQKHPWTYVSEMCSYYHLVQEEVGKRQLQMDWKYLVDHTETSLNLVKQGHAISILDREIAAPAVEEGSICIWPQYQHKAKIYLAWQSRRTSEKLIATYLETSKEAFDFEVIQAPA
jgi:DNA-binding transcriptional LysR family regulator